MHPGLIDALRGHLRKSTNDQHAVQRKIFGCPRRNPGF
jgi:hypothetical protein